MAGTRAEAQPMAARPLAWRGGFGRLWSAAVVSGFGDAFRRTAIPLLAYAVTDSPLLISLVTACEFLPWVLFGLLGGAIADRVDQRRAMWLVDVVRGLLMAAFALAVALGQASIALLIAVSFLLTTLQTVFDNAATALLPSVVPKESLGSANARLLTGQQIVTRFAGAPLAPLLIGTGLALPYLVDALTYLIAAALVASLGTVLAPRKPASSGGALRRDIADGIRVLWRGRSLRAICLSGMLVNTGIGGLIATLVVLVRGWLGAGNFGFVAVTSGYGIGMVAGGLVAARIARAVGQGRALLIGGLVQTGCLISLGTVRDLLAAALALGVFGFAGMVSNVVQTTMLQQYSPEGMLGRVSACYRTLGIAGVPLGALAAGATATAWGLNTPALLAAALFALGMLALIPALRRT